MPPIFAGTTFKPAAALAAGIALAALAGPAFAVPSFAAQTGMACNVCHVGGFGPQLTVYGRQFKLQGYTQRSNTFAVPFSAMAVASYLRTQKDQSPPAGFNPNDNVALDQFSLFFASGLGSHLGAFVQATYDGIAKAWSWDNLDVRATTTATVGKTDLLLGASLNNSPAVQDAWNTLPAWGYPYTGSALAPSPSAAPLLAGGLAQNTLGLTGYAWIDSKLYLEAGAYGSPRANLLTSLGADPFSPGKIKGVAPYERIAYQTIIGGHGTLEVGAFGMQANIYPGRDQSAGADSYRDLGLDATYIVNIGDGDVVTANARYIDERQILDASQRLGLAEHRHNAMHDYRADVSYYWRNRIGGTVGVFRTDGSADGLLYADNRTSKPDSTGLMLQVDATPWGAGSPFGKRFNLRVGAQYTYYPEFNGARRNYDGAGAYAGDNNTFRVFTWVAF